MRIVYGITGFAAGVMAGLLLGVIESKLMIALHRHAFVPLVIGVTMLICIISGIVIAVKYAAKRIR
jgi:ABC-type antimicrobial peptide transport system permease subunit